MFKVGDLVICKKDCYKLTNQFAICRVEKVENGTLVVRVVGFTNRESFYRCARKYSTISKAEINGYLLESYEVLTQHFKLYNPEEGSWD